MHKTTGQWQLGLLLSLLTAMLWGLLPIALKGLLQYSDPVTITWYRFLIAGVALFGYLWVKGRLPKLSKLKDKSLLMLAIIVIAGLLGNYILYMVGLSYITPGAAQVMIQTAPMLLLIGGLILFKESFQFKQWIGLITFCFGLVLFFNQRLEELLTTLSDYTIGMLFIFTAGVLWAAYALAQKQLLKDYASEEIMVMIYLVGILVFLPNAEPLTIKHYDGLGWLLLLFCGANTLIAYGAFAEALDHWEASRVSATLALTPLLTLLFMQITHYFAPEFLQPEPVNNLSIIGALLVVAGSAVTALSKSKAVPVDGADGVPRLDEPDDESKSLIVDK
ncbi:DMT family transporter [Pleionea mediterranea]|uniref:Drug/metabolite transporter (DMT)-like permease n=1 Tax=Pleionea mediterranea TaxID=523701 RepID=A0A316G0H7_9GAMM|nr:DMT family transporter [Pleionea mediterranea]PWK54411.1 drug/metabolite transporter (DMT)-like permease [Pleionea mediterranea]